jgi:hypothetical protein
MKKELIFGSLMALSGISNAQALWNGSGYTGDSYRSGRIGINVSTMAMELELSTSSTNSGIGITQTTSGFSALRLFNTSTGGKNYALVSTGAGNGEGAGHFGLYDYTSSVYRLFMQGSTGRIGIGIGSSSPNSMLHVFSNDAQATNNVIQSAGFFIEPTSWAGYFQYSGTSKLGVHAAVHGYDLNNAPTTLGDLVQGIGVFGKAERTAVGSGNSSNMGVYGRALGADNFNVGGAFYGSAQDNVGYRTTPDGNNSSAANFGVWASASGNGATAGYFNGCAYSVGSYQAADASLKREIQPLTNAVDKLKQLKPVVYNFNTEENPNMNLPADRQMGFNAQDIEKVMPELVKEIKDLSTAMETGKAEDIRSFKAVNYVNLIPLLVSAVQDQAKTAEAQQKQIDDQKQVIEQQKLQTRELLAKTETMTDINQISAVVPGFQLDQNIPNPFGDQTAINYTLPDNIKNAYMGVYDLTGKQIMIITIKERGSSSININASQLSPGIYIYSVIGDGKVLDSKRMVVEQKQ